MSNSRLTNQGKKNRKYRKKRNKQHNRKNLLEKKINDWHEADIENDLLLREYLGMTIKKYQEMIIYPGYVDKKTYEFLSRF